MEKIHTFFYFELVSHAFEIDTVMNDERQTVSLADAMIVVFKYNSALLRSQALLVGREQSLRSSLTRM